MSNLSSCLSYMFGLRLLAGFLDFDMSAGLFQLGFVLEILNRLAPLIWLLGLYIMNTFAMSL